MEIFRPEVCNIIKKETPTQVFSCVFHKIFKKTFFYRTPPVAASVLGISWLWSNWTPLLLPIQSLFYELDLYLQQVCKTKLQITIILIQTFQEHFFLHLFLKTIIYVSKIILCCTEHFYLIYVLSYYMIYSSWFYVLASYHQLVSHWLKQDPHYSTNSLIT